MKYKIRKTQEGSLQIKNPNSVARALSALPPGNYEVEINPENDLLTRMKKYYFLMETKLAIHLGYQDKTDIHEYLKQHIGQTKDEHGQSVYESIADVVDCDHMMQRIYEFQQYVALAFDYTFEPFNNEEHDKLPRLDGMGFGTESQQGD